MIDVAAFMMTMTFFASADTPQPAIAFGRQQPAGENVDLVANDEFFAPAVLATGGFDATDILADDLDLLAGDGVAVLLHIKLNAFVDLLGRVGELAGIRQLTTPILMVSWALAAAGSMTAASKAAPANSERFIGILP